MSHSRFRRHRGLAGLVAAVCCVVLLATSCAGRYGITAAGANSAPTDRTLRLSFLQDPGQPPDPDVFYALQGLLLTTNMYEGLLTYKKGTAQPVLEGLLATSWTASKDNRVFTLTLRKGVTFHDGTPFTAAAVKPSFDRRLAVNQGPAYMVADVKSVETRGDYGVTITLNKPDAAFLAYLASPYGPRMMSPTALKQHSGSDHAQTYLMTHSIGTGPYQLTDARIGAHYAMRSYAGYWGGQPYFRSVDIPVINDTSAQQLQFNNGEIAAILHSIPTSAVAAYAKHPALRSYNLPTMQSDYLYVNPYHGFLTDAANRRALLRALNVDALVKAAYQGRGTKATQLYPANMMAKQYAVQDIRHDLTPLRRVVQALPEDKRSLVIGYDSSSSDNQLVANLIAAQLAQVGLTGTVMGYPTAQTFGWVGNGVTGPDVFVTVSWPDAPPPYMWAHISFDPDGGLNYLQCSDKATTALIAAGRATGSAEVFSEAATKAFATGCWMNLVNIDDFMVAQPWLEGVEQAHTVSAPGTLSIAQLSVKGRS